MGNLFPSMTKPTAIQNSELLLQYRTSITYKWIQTFGLNTVGYKLKD